MSFSIAENLNKIKNTIPEDVSLVAVSKTKPIQDLKKAYDAGQRVFGENKVQELREKQPQLPNDIEWHMIGHVQSNKVKYIAPYIALIHGVESFKLLEEINKQALKNERVIKILLQFHIATESTKFGLQLKEAKEILDSDEFKKLENIEVSGVMGMASFVENESQVRLEFATLKSIFEELKSNYFSSNDSFKIVSMGMSGDYPIAIEEGSTMIRVGSSIFGTRN
jgi:pyridoxal phosphate enzyme (YggS family)